MNWPFSGGEDGKGETEKMDGNTGKDVQEIDQKKIQKAIVKRERALNQVADNIQNCQDAYREYLHKGAKSTSAAKRQVFAMKARMEKYKGNLNQLKQLKFLRDISKLTLLTGQAEIREMIDDISSEHELIDAAAEDPESFQADIDEVEAELKADMDDISDMMSGMDVEMGDMEVEQTEEQKLMSEIAAGDKNIDEVVEENTDDLLNSVDVEDEDVSPAGF